jgi:hypothetical protein
MKDSTMTLSANPTTDVAPLVAVECRPLEMPELAAISGGDVIVTFN